MNIGQALYSLRQDLLSNHQEVKTERWQGMEDPPLFIEILHSSVKCQMSDSISEAASLTGASLPWADVHFDERVSGIPYNPPPSHSIWLKDTEKFFSEDEKFSHTYPERMWPNKEVKGIRFNQGDLNTAIQLLKKEKYTRQCYIPIWFPEDISAALQGERVPCTFGWHFLIRENEIHCFYPMRSCDAVRHLHNDLYFVNRLALWIRDQIDPDIKPGILHFSSTSLHCFKNDLYYLQKILRKNES